MDYWDGLTGENYGNKEREKVKSPRTKGNYYFLLVNIGLTSADLTWTGQEDPISRHIMNKTINIWNARKHFTYFIQYAIEYDSFSMMYLELYLSD